MINQGMCTTLQDHIVSWRCCQSPLKQKNWCWMWCFSLLWWSPAISHLVGGLEHGFYDFPFSWEFHKPNWRNPWFFRVGQPPTSHCIFMNSALLVEYKFFCSMKGPFLGGGQTKNISSWSPVCPCMSHDEITVIDVIPSDKHTKNYGKIHHFQWENPLFLWSFSIANC